MAYSLQRVKQNIITTTVALRQSRTLTTEGRPNKDPNLRKQEDQEAPRKVFADGQSNPKKHQRVFVEIKLEPKLALAARTSDHENL